MYSVYLEGFRFLDDQEGNFYLTFNYADEPFLSYYALNLQGNLEEKYRYYEKDDWVLGWSALKIECDVYGKCGAFGSCNPQNSPICSCIPGFEPKNTEEWNKGNLTSGCARRTSSQCERVTTSGEEGKKDGFLPLNMMKVSDNADWSSPRDQDKCREKCLENCSCLHMHMNLALDVCHGLET